MESPSTGSWPRRKRKQVQVAEGQRPHQRKRLLELAVGQMCIRDRVEPGPGLPLERMPLEPISDPLPQLEPPGYSITCEIIPSSAAGLDSDLAAGPVDANILAGRLNHLCNMRNIRVIVLDGPQAWKSRHNGLEHARVSERQLNTAAKTGLPGMVKPITYRRCV